VRVADYIVNYLITQGVTDVFGLPGGVVLDFLYALDKRKDKIKPHLNYHEQAAAFAACGYAQTTGRLGVAYATRGPGIANMLTAVADAYYDSTPVLFITAHGNTRDSAGMRIYAEQEMNPIPLVEEISKYAVRIDKLADIKAELIKACSLAVTDRKGPVVLDILSSLWVQDIDNPRDNVAEATKAIANALPQARRPVLLIGDGLREPKAVFAIKQFAMNTQIPILSSRFAQDIVPDSAMYFGYIGSHATRYSNFILAKADLIIALGNRLAFPVESASFRPIVEGTQIIRVDIDDNEFIRAMPNSQNFAVDAGRICNELASLKCHYNEEAAWLNICNELKASLWSYDTEFPIDFIAKILTNIPADSIIVSDVGNNEFWLSRAYTYAKAVNRILYSKSFGALGCAIPKAIGAFYTRRKPVVCFVGDQGLQLNIQELEYIAQHQLPIMIIVLNNFASGMIKDAEVKRFEGALLHTTLASGYGVPDIQAVAKAYGIEYYFLEQGSNLDWIKSLDAASKPFICEIKIAEEVALSPTLPKDNSCQDLQPGIDRALYDYLDAL